MKKYNKLKSLATLAVLATAGIYLINRAIFFICSLKDALPSKNSNIYQWRFGNYLLYEAGKRQPNPSDSSD